MKKTDFDMLLAGLDDALAYAKGNVDKSGRAHFVEVDRVLVAAARLEAGHTSQGRGDCRGAPKRRRRGSTT
jgi:hypothetical protein